MSYSQHYIATYDIIKKAEDEISELMGTQCALTLRIHKSASHGSLAYVLRTVCNALQLTPADINSQSRKRNLSDARKIFCLIAREQNAYFSLRYIASNIGNRDHSTVIYNIQAARNLLTFDPTFIKKYKACVAALSENEN